MRLCLWQAAALIMLTVNIGLSPGREHFLFFLHVAIGVSILIAVLVSALLRWPQLRPGQRLRSIAGLALMTCYLGAAGRLDLPNAFFIVFLQGAGLSLTAGQRHSEEKNPFQALVIASAVYSFAVLSDQVFLWTGRLAAPLLSIVELAGRISGYPLEKVSFTYLGGWLWIVVIPLVVILLAGTPARRLPLHLPALLLLALALVLQAADPGFLRLWLLVTAAALSMMFVSPPFPCGPLARLMGPKIPHLDKSRVFVLAGFLLAAGGILLLFLEPACRLHGSSKSVMLEGDYSVRIPDADSPQQPAGASLGRFCRFMERTAGRFERRGTIESGSLRDIALLVICNLARELGEQEIEEVVHFVEGGGGLLVLGDHTDISGVMHCTNRLISRFGIKLKFDSAIPLPGPGWEGALDLKRFPASGRVVPPDTIKVSVGASLDLSGCARPLLVARSGFSDRGDRSAPERAFLGNWAADPGLEQLGDLVLAAETRVGKGRVAVFGDTAFLQEGSFSMSWPFVACLLDWMVLGDSTFFSRTSVRITGLLALLAALAMIVLPGRSGIKAALTALLALAVFVTIQEWQSSRRGPSEPRVGQTAWIDLKGGSNLAIGKSGRADPGGFESGLAACGFLPLYLEGNREIEPGKNDLLVYPSGRRRLEADEMKRMFRFVEGGGRVIFFIGPDDRKAVRPLLEKLGVVLTSIPLGFCPVGEAAWGDGTPTFCQAWGMKTEESSLEPEVVVSCWQYPVVLAFRLGKGSLYLISDPQFPWDRNFKQGHEFNVRNFNFLEQLLSESGGKSI